jgi:hypothetical protein
MRLPTRSSQQLPALHHVWSMSSATDSGGCSLGVGVGVGVEEGERGRCTHLLQPYVHVRLRTACVAVCKSARERVDVLKSSGRVACHICSDRTWWPFAVLALCPHSRHGDHHDQPTGRKFCRNVLLRQPVQHSPLEQPLPVR